MEQTSLGKRIQLIRKSLGLSQNDFGKHFSPKVNKSTVSRWEHDQVMPEKQKLDQIAKMGGVSTDYLINGTQASQAELVYAGAQENDPSLDPELKADLFQNLGSLVIKGESVTKESQKQLHHLVANHYRNFKKLSLSARELICQTSRFITKYDDTPSLNSRLDASSYIDQSSEELTYLSRLIQSIMDFDGNATNDNRRKAQDQFDQLMDLFEPNHNPHPDPSSPNDYPNNN